MAECSSCGRAVRWGVTTTGARMPLDVAPAPLGNVWIRGDGKLRVLSEPERARARTAGYVLYVPHHATCPSVAQHRVSPAQEALDV